MTPGAPFPPPPPGRPGLPRPSGGTGARTSDVFSAPAGARVGPYEVLGEIARGGAGVVLLGRGPDERQVAIKVLKQGGDVAAERFARERALQSELGLAEGFVPLVAAGEGPGGPWIAMPFLPGGTLRDRLRRGPLPVAEAIDLVRRLAEALGRAHARGIVHRDLKPENVLFTTDGVPLVADLGLAKREGAPTGMSLSVTGEFRGTAGYMAPEQMKDAKTAGPPADVFSLGAILYECLAGEPAFAGDTVVAVIEHVDTGRVVPLSKRRPDVPRWLVRVVARCLEREVEARIEDGAALAAALTAGPAGAARRLPRPHATSLAIGLVVGAALGFAAGAWWRGAGPEPTTSGPAPVAVVPAQPVEPPPVEPAPVSAPSDEPSPVEPTPEPPAPRAEPYHPGRATRLQSPALGGAAIDMDLGASKLMQVTTRWGTSRLRHTAGINAISLARGADLMVSGDDHGLVRVWLRTTGQQRYKPLVLAGPIHTLALGDDGNLVAYVDRDGKANVRDLRTDNTTGLEVQSGSPTLAMAWAPNTSVLVTTCADRSLNIWDLATRRSLGRTVIDTPVTAVAFSADAKTAVIGTESGAFVAYDATDPTAWSQRAVIDSGDHPVRRVALSPDGRYAAGLIPGRGLMVWDVSSNSGLVYENLTRGEARDLAFAPDGTTVVAVDADSIVGFDCVSRQLLTQQRFSIGVRAAAVSVGAPMRVVFSGLRGGGLAWVDVGAPDMEPSVGHSGWVTATVARGPTLFSYGADGTLRRWKDPDTSTVLLDRDGWFHELELARDDRLLLTTWSHAAQPLGGLLVLDVTADRAAFSAEGNVQVLSGTFARDGRSALAANAPGTIDLVDLATAEVQSWRAHARSVRWVRRLTDGRIVTSGAEDVDRPAIALWPTTGGPEPLRRTRLGPHRSLAVVPGGGATVVVGGVDGALSWWDLDTGLEVRRVEGAHAGMIGAVAISPDGRLGASGGSDRTLRLWDARDGRELERVALTGSLDMVTSLRFDDQGLFVGLGTGVVVLLRPRS